MVWNVAVSVIKLGHKLVLRPISSSIMVLLQGLCYVVDITMVFLTFIGIFDFVFHLVELSRGLLLLNLPYRTVR